ncbi:hypothetical protein [Tenggerimyces flavus]|uniref:Uncharacterized protein n=1 Tax=Tenggerimyces flavus TaxID=1708749 RepID=A0ABV7YNA6_9ACTN|nr:hypothetical protein [Tenggerimyces flavus]MBM7786456.1 hypothetical protein [Tenggerimyces flavus]
MRLRTAVLAGALAVGGGLFAFAAPASAAPVTQCTGDLGAVTVSGNLSVPADQTCTLNGTIVNGTATIGKNANLLVLAGTIKRNVTVNAGGYFDTTGSTLGQNVYLIDAAGTRLDTTKVAGSVRSSDNNKGFAGFIFGDSAEVSGNVEQFATGELLLERSTVSGSVRGIDNTYTQLYRTTVGRNLDAFGNVESVVVCESKVNGDGAFFNNTGVVQLGVGEIFSCTGQNEWGDDVSVSSNDAALTVTNNLIHGDLCGYRNTPAPTGSENVVEGRKSGQFVNLQPTPVPAG